MRRVTKSVKRGEYEGSDGETFRINFYIKDVLIESIVFQPQNLQVLFSILTSQSEHPFLKKFNAAPGDFFEWSAELFDEIVPSECTLMDGKEILLKKRDPSKRWTSSLSMSGSMDLVYNGSSRLRDISVDRAPSVLSRCSISTGSSVSTPRRLTAARSTAEAPTTRGTPSETTVLPSTHQPRIPSVRGPPRPYVALPQCRQSRSGPRTATVSTNRRRPLLRPRPVASPGDFRPATIETTKRPASPASLLRPGQSPRQEWSRMTNLPQQLWSLDTPV
ncbi:hypothetical protein L596_006582 [Steinernema carpocapsae]|uniref:Uncharacterized protein n=1 Tax=Steinernema carpocapsae TaxID=34508 RepID=A0A4U8V544_STECR|nr:hypothetical protein L596_006582 [Steinernema carpocapsae]